jgi:hypothetical protein
MLEPTDLLTLNLEGRLKINASEEAQDQIPLVKWSLAFSSPKMFVQLEASLFSAGVEWRNE